MIIKPHKSPVAIFCIIFVFCIGVCFFYAIVCDSYSFSLVFVVSGILYSLFALRVAFGEFRTLEINKYGCEIKFLFYKRLYKWEELKTVKIQSFIHTMYGRTSMRMKGIVFSTRTDFKFPENVSDSLYLDLHLNPFCFFIVLFKSQNKNNKPLYEVEEEPFMKLLEEYGVEVQK